MKIALFGAGKTGSKALECARGAEIIGPFTRTRVAAAEDLREADCAVVFVPGESLPLLMPTLLEAGIPVVCGATGYLFTPELKQLIAERGIPWVQGSNFSLGMNLAFALARRMGQFLPAQTEGELSITEVHHAKKLDSPSGTALSLERALGRKVPIQSLREGDVMGEHKIELALPGERLTLSHSVSDRRIFAEGALWAARLVKEQQLAPGFHLFEDIVRQYCFERSGE